MRASGCGRRLPYASHGRWREKLGATFHVNARLASGAAIVAEQRETTACPGAMLDLHFDPIRARLFTDAGTRLR
ncbi:hypothetical protein [Cypionkella sp.]|uniref:hypothetical protein n=1 Tax=Cypionkella sp. TaxID=2811411 RepID=UPI00271D18B7|nr:hypothetical protein [Cypionkella sp.]MDO8982156.1 hypothetical protein [Cypionkella sp.]MDP2048611.1 hypothetical protein [Cypionkella sp.]